MFKLAHVKFKEILNIEKLTIPENQVTCITGKSGSGKTTFLKLLNGLITPDSGTVFVDDKNVDDWDLVELRRHVIMLQQTPSIYEGSIKHNLNIARQFSGLEPADDEELREALKQVRLNKELDRDVDDLSGGEKQRVALARVLLLKPSALLLDEPTSAIDDETARGILKDIFAAFKRNGQTVVMVTHQKQMIAEFADHIVTLDGGKITDERSVEHGRNH